METPAMRRLFCWMLGKCLDCSGCCTLAHIYSQPPSPLCLVCLSSLWDLLQQFVWLPPKAGALLHDTAAKPRSPSFHCPPSAGLGGKSLQHLQEWGQAGDLPGALPPGA
eukprot:scaffold179213_cov17-Tisochrysis_lutea.AAC.2